MTADRDISVYSRRENPRLIDERLKEINKRSMELARPGDYKEIVAKEIANSRRKALRIAKRSILSNIEARPFLFLSYSGLGKPLAERAKAMAGEYGFQVKTGFDKEVDLAVDELSDDVSLPQAIISQIVSSSCFLGIWTDDYVSTRNKPGMDGRGMSVAESQGTIPSVWLPFELGIAASHELPFRLLVAEGTHRLYYEQPFNIKKQIMFDAGNFVEQLSTAMQYFRKRLRAKQAADLPQSSLRAAMAQWSDED